MSNKLYADMTPDEKAEIDRQEDSREAHKDALVESDVVAPTPAERPWNPWNAPKPVPTDADVEALKNTIEALKAESKALSREERELNDRIVALRARRYAIIGDSHRYGELRGAEAKLAEATLLRADDLLPKVRMRRKAALPGPWENRIVAANGPKRGSLRLPGSDRCENIPSNYYEVHPDDRHMLRCYEVKVETE